MDTNTKGEKVFLLGGTGYLGTAIVRKLVDAGFTPLVLIRDGAERKIPKKYREKCEFIVGDAARLDLVKNDIRTASPTAIIYTIGLARETMFSSARFLDYHYNWAKAAADIAGRLEIPKFIYISSLGVKRFGTQAQMTKYQFEQYLQRSNLNYTIFRPSVMLGNDRQYHFMRVLKRLLQMKVPLLPNGGNQELDVVFRDDVAQAVVNTVKFSLQEEDQTYRQIFELGGPERLKFSDLLRRVSKHYHWSYLPIPFPAALIWPFARLFRRFPLFPISDEQLAMTLEGSTARDQAAWNVLEIQPVKVDQMLETYQLQE
jgi:nucleoside-diphosphate-sugar epimerase